MKRLTPIVALLLLAAAGCTSTSRPPAWQGAIVELSQVTFSVSQFYRSKEVGPLRKTAQGVFAVVKLSMTNNNRSKPVSTIWDFSFELKDSAGRRFAIDGLTSYTLRGEDCPLEINPGLSGCKVIAFDIPEDARGLRIGIDLVSQFRDPLKWIALE